jgi:hypothetical protein
MAVTPDSIYQLIKSYEGQFDPPAPYFPITVGTFDVDTGDFAGLKMSSETDPEPVEHGPHDKPRNPPPHYVNQEWVSVAIDAHWRRTITKTPAPQVPLQPVLLFFSISHAIADSWSLTVNGETFTAEPGQTFQRVDIWDSQVANWTIQANGLAHADTLRIQRPAGALKDASAGAFTIPVLPVTIIYAPPADAGKLSTATYTQGETHGDTVTFDTSSDTSHTAPTQIVGTAGLKSFLDATTEALTAAGYPVAAKVLSTISSQIGELSASETDGISDQSEVQMTITETTSAALSTSAAVGGPGVGDVIYYYHNIRMVWAYGSGGLRLCPIGYQEASFPVQALQDNLSAIGLSLADAQSLLGLDPFVAGGPGAALSTDRFEQRATWEYGFGSNVHLTDSVTRDTKLQTTHATYTTKTDGWDAGPILKELGFGGSDQTTFKVSNATGSDISTTVTLDANLASGANDYFVVNLWFDKVFGSFAFQVEQPATTARLQGQGAKPNAVIKLTAGGRVFSTVVRSDGTYSFYARAIPSGRALLTIGGSAGQDVMVS